MSSSSVQTPCDACSNSQSLSSNLASTARALFYAIYKTLIFVAFFQSILKDIRMERSKIRPTDNIRTFYLARFFVEYLLILRQKEIAQQEQDVKGKGVENGNGDGHVDPLSELSLGLVAEMAEMETVRWIVMRMKYSLDDKVWCPIRA